MTDKDEFVVPADFASYERVRAMKEGAASFLDSEYDNIKLVGASLIFLDTKTDVRFEHKEKVSWFDESEYDEDSDAWDEEEE